jgi:hypothetical protein
MGDPWLCAPASRRVCPFVELLLYTEFNATRQIRELGPRSARLCDPDSETRAARGTVRERRRRLGLAARFYTDAQTFLLEALLVELGQLPVAALDHRLAGTVGLPHELGSAPVGDSPAPISPLGLRRGHSKDILTSLLSGRLHRRDYSRYALSKGCHRLSDTTGPITHQEASTHSWEPVVKNLGIDPLGTGFAK